MLFRNEYVVQHSVVGSMGSDGVMEGQWVMLGVAMGSYERRGVTQSSRGTPKSRIVIGRLYHFRDRFRDAYRCGCRNTAQQEPCRYSTERCGIGGLRSIPNFGGQGRDSDLLM
ncbi:hypothetical protein HBH56_001510 [Parastagonospora nodorum]|uniref:Uncharacterized protein n=1 Tax=Phaeosphaeria nodorum (strain SN15 / ATCC MYA-4574 / FGSC 10173) TaxID=321614 RepID=A0A7U2ENJ6_PHANO|nr:hypothetical protein HBH56_001510 [Parastagonospora nodorum]QRC90129.1 hypothetical protein JI435_400170 [Parastagonospora nodorum SN15]KAH3937738.1 hypothetical protein HBH54_001520 [Parastagonospora nodorum]KAH4001631.1 hypothetical protein HBI10_090440 [Parastagonospora nodorum]KAH4027461.1 hypothetical protein HBI13_059460 [Parastagonospora nodorum]